VTKSETAKILLYIKGAYPSAFRDFKETDTEVTIRVWADILSDVSFADASRAAKKYIRAGSPFPPGAGEIYRLAAGVPAARGEFAGFYITMRDEGARP
jgi:hypothetical protein